MGEHAYTFWKKFDFNAMPLDEMAGRITMAAMKTLELQDASKEQLASGLHMMHKQFLTALRHAWKRCPEPSLN